jgi:hypothetical protein
MFISCYGDAQKAYITVNLTSPFSGISYTNGHNREEFRPSVARINLSWGVDFHFKSKRFHHKLSVEQIPFEKYFKIINKFNQPPNTGLLGFLKIQFSSRIDHFVFSYALQKDGKREKGFLFHSKIRFNYSFGAGIGVNRSEWYYENGYRRSADGWASPYTYAGYEAVHHRDGIGIFLRGTGGFDFINKRKNKRVLSVNVFYNQGLKDMAHFDIHYQYGYWNDPSKQVDVPKQVLRSRGTTFGFSLGFPITIKK